MRIRRAKRPHPSLADRSALCGQLLLFAALYGGYGALSPFLPAFLKDRGLSAQEIAWLLAAAMLARMATGPLIGALADRYDSARRLLGLAFVAAGALTLAFLPFGGFPSLLAIGLVQAVATAPLAPLADALALTAARGGRAFAYGRVRAAGSAAFIAMSVLTGVLVARYSSASGLALGGALFVLAAGVTAGIGLQSAIAESILPPGAMRGDAFDRDRRDPARSREPAFEAAPQDLGMMPGNAHSLLGGFRALFALGRFRSLVLAAACVIGAHAMQDAFAVIVWRDAGIDAGIAGLLWAESVAAEIAAFLWFGPRLVARLGPGRVLALCALAGAVRWVVQAQTSWLPALGCIQALHGLTFASLHLACLAGIEASVPASLRATALSTYGTLGLGLATALTTLASGSLYAAFGQSAFLAMSGLSLAALPFAWSLRGVLPSDACVSAIERVQTENKDLPVP